MGATLDSHASAAISSASSGTIGITTVGSNVVVEIEVACEVNSTSAAPSITVSGGGLTWARRPNGQFPFSSTNVQVGGANLFGTAVDKWWALCASPTALTITITFGAAIDDASVVARGWLGADTVTPYDPNASLPASVISITHTGVAPSVGGVSTTNANTVVTGTVANFKGGGSGGVLLTANAGYQLVNTNGIDGNANNGAVNNSLVQTEGQIFSSAQSGITVGFVEARQDWYMIADAIQAAGAAAANPPYNPWPQLGPMVAQ